MESLQVLPANETSSRAPSAVPRFPLLVGEGGYQSGYTGPVDGYHLSCADRGELLLFFLLALQDRSNRVSYFRWRPELYQRCVPPPLRQDVAPTSSGGFAR